MRFLIDTQLPQTLVDWIRGSGNEAIHVLDVGLAQGKDNSVWAYAEREHAIIISKDDDFSKWVRQGRAGPKVVWLRIGNASNPSLLFWIGSRWSQVIEKLENGERRVEVI